MPVHSNIDPRVWNCTVCTSYSAGAADPTCQFPESIRYSPSDPGTLVSLAFLSCSAQDGN